MKSTTKLWIGIALLIVLSPLGLLLPEYFKSGAAWGEWGVAEVKGLAGYIPRGLEKLSNLWKAPISDYTFKGWEEKGLSHVGFAYIISAAAGVLIIVIVALGIGKLLVKKGD